MRTLLNLLVLIACLDVAPARAALPDRVAFGVAIELGDVASARRWLDEGLDPDMEADRVGTGLMIGAWEGNIPMMALFLERGADLHKVNRQGEQALQLAAWRGKVEAVRWLLDRGASVSREGKAWSALHYAVFAGHEDIARMLMARGADINARAPNDATVLMMAAREGRESLARVLVDAGADTRLANDRGDTALTWAMRNGNLRIARLVAPTAEFAEAVRSAPVEAQVPPRRSVVAPSEITRLLKRLREAEAAGQSTEALRKALMAAVDTFRREARPLGQARPPAAKVSGGRTLTITASRSGGGERAEVMTTPARMSWDYEESRLNELTERMRQLDEAEKAGRPKAELSRLRREAQEAYRRMKGN